MNNILQSAASKLLEQGTLSGIAQAIAASNIPGLPEWVQYVVYLAAAIKIFLPG